MLSPGGGKKARTYIERYVAVVTTHYAQMVWLSHCVAFFSRQLHLGQCPVLHVIAALDGFQGMQAQVILASLVSEAQGIMTTICRANTLTITVGGGVPGVEALEKGQKGTRSVGLCSCKEGPVVGLGTDHGKQSVQGVGGAA